LRLGSMPLSLAFWYLLVMVAQVRCANVPDSGAAPADPALSDRQGIVLRRGPVSATGRHPLPHGLKAGLGSQSWLLLIAVALSFCMRVTVAGRSIRRGTDTGSARMPSAPASSSSQRTYCSRYRDCGIHANPKDGV
jgi:hypothetical protein